MTVIKSIDAEIGHQKRVAEDWVNGYSERYPEIAEIVLKSISADHKQLAEWLEELKSLRSMRDSIVKIINENNAPAAWKYDMIVDEVMEHENFGCGED